MKETGSKVKISILLNKDMAHRIFHPNDLEFLRSFADIEDIETLPEKMTEEYMAKAVKGADGCITCWGTPKVTEAVLSQAPGLKILAHGAGTPKAVVTDGIWERNVKVFTAAPIIAIDVAETALGLIICSIKRIFKFNRMTHAGLWKKSNPEVDREEDKMLRLYRYLNIGIIGASHVGRNLIRFLKPFGADLLLYDPFVNEEQAEALGVKKVSLEELMSTSDVVTIHAPNLPSTNHMINRENLSLMKDGAVLINTARGAIVDEPALLEELKKGRIFACLDVTDPEPPSKENELRGLENVVLTPHISGGHTINGRYELGHYLVQELYSFFTKGVLQYEVKKEMMEFMA